MIKHLVVWKLAATDDAARDLAAREIVEAFAGLESRIPQLVSIGIERNMAAFDRNWDLVLVSEFESLDDLAAYQAHPEHLVAAAVPSARVTERASIDYEF